MESATVNAAYLGFKLIKTIFQRQKIIDKD